VRTVLIRDLFDLGDAVLVNVLAAFLQDLDISVGHVGDQTYSDLVGLVGSVLLHETLGSRGRDVGDSVGSFSRHVG
jgi:hypothetical protein